ncbi:hypothetical protein DFQ26_002775 [Actinomortierella ambigua]|nr:hypothetical protein DFQ26_002775 [Actinomortierella ambigua]
MVGALECNGFCATVKGDFQACVWLLLGFRGMIHNSLPSIFKSVLFFLALSTLASSVLAAECSAESVALGRKTYCCLNVANTPKGYQGTDCTQGPCSGTVCDLNPGGRCTICCNHFQTTGNVAYSCESP